MSALPFKTKADIQSESPPGEPKKTKLDGNQQQESESVQKPELDGMIESKPGTRKKKKSKAKKKQKSKPDGKPDANEGLIEQPGPDEEKRLKQSEDSQKPELDEEQKVKADEAQKGISKEVQKGISKEPQKATADGPAKTKDGGAEKSNQQKPKDGGAVKSNQLKLKIGGTNEKSLQLKPRLSFQGSQPQKNLNPLFSFQSKSLPREAEKEKSDVFDAVGYSSEEVKNAITAIKHSQDALEVNEGLQMLLKLAGKGGKRVCQELVKLQALPGLMGLLESQDFGNVKDAADCLVTISKHKKLRPVILNESLFLPLTKAMREESPFPTRAAVAVLIQPEVVKSKMDALMFLNAGALPVLVELLFAHEQEQPQIEGSQPKSAEGSISASRPSKASEATQQAKEVLQPEEEGEQGEDEELSEDDNCKAKETEVELEFVADTETEEPIAPSLGEKDDAGSSLAASNRSDASFVSIDLTNSVRSEGPLVAGRDLEEKEPTGFQVAREVEVKKDAPFLQVAITALHSLAQFSCILHALLQMDIISRLADLLSSKHGQDVSIAEPIVGVYELLAEMPMGAEAICLDEGGKAALALMDATSNLPKTTRERVVGVLLISGAADPSLAQALTTLGIMSRLDTLGLEG